MLTLGWELILWIFIGRLAGDGPPIVGPVAVLAVAFALALAVIVVAARRLRADADAHPLTFAELLVVVGVLGLLVAALLSFQCVVTIAMAEWLRFSSLTPEGRHLRFAYLDELGNFATVLPAYIAVFSSGGPILHPPSHSGTVAIQIFSFVVPCAVILSGMRMRVADLRAGADQIRPPNAFQVATCLSVLALTFWCSIAPVTFYTIAAENSFFLYDDFGYHSIDLAFFAVGGAGPVLALLFLLARRRRTLEAGNTTWLLIPAGLAALTTGSAAGSHSLPLLALLAAALLAGLFWAYGVAGPSRHDGDEVAGAGHLLAAVAALGLVILVAALPEAIDAIARWRLFGQYDPEMPPYGFLIVMPAVACAINFGLLTLALRYLGAAGERARKGA